MDRTGLEEVGPTVTASSSISRLKRAAFLFLLRPIVPLGDHHYQIGSEDGLRHYEVLNGHCQCSDYVRRGAGHPCKHRLALSFYHRLECTHQGCEGYETK